MFNSNKKTVWNIIPAIAIINSSKELVLIFWLKMVKPPNGKIITLSIFHLKSRPVTICPNSCIKIILVKL